MNYVDRFVSFRRSQGPEVILAVISTENEYGCH